MSDQATHSPPEQPTPPAVDAAPAATRTDAQPVAGRLAMMAGVSLALGAIPLPFLPDRVLLQLRGAVAHEVSSRHGLSLSSDARAVLARPNAKDRMRSLLRKGIELITRRLLRRVGPLAPLSALVTSFEVYALGHLLDRYFAEVRHAGALRILEGEAQRVRSAIDEAVLMTFYPSTQPSTLLLGESVEDLRDEFTRWLDTIIVGASTLPNYMQRRLDAAFDEVIRRSPEFRNE